MMRLRRMIYLIAAVATGACMNLNIPDVTIDLGEIESAGRPGGLCIPVDTAIVSRPVDRLGEVEDNISESIRLLLVEQNQVLLPPRVYLSRYGGFVLSTRTAQVCASYAVDPGVYDVVLEVWDLHGGIYHFTASVTVKGE